MILILIGANNGYNKNGKRFEDGMSDGKVDEGYLERAGFYQVLVFQFMMS